MRRVKVLKSFTYTQGAPRLFSESARTPAKCSYIVRQATSPCKFRRPCSGAWRVWALGHRWKQSPHNCQKFQDRKWSFAPVTSSVCSLPPPAPFFLHRAAVCFGSIIHLPIAVQYSVLSGCISRQSERIVRTLNGNHCWKQLPIAGEICTTFSPSETNTYLTKTLTTQPAPNL